LSRSGPSSTAATIGRPGNAAQQILEVKTDQERLVQAAEDYAGQRVERLRLALRLAGLERDSASVEPPLQSSGGPLIGAKDPRALAAILDVDEGFAARIQSAARRIEVMRALDRSTHSLPLATPLANPVRSSPYGARIDPFTGRTAFHPGQDFSGARMTPVLATASGAVSFTGQRTGYGNVVELSHVDGFMTRYAHLASIGVQPGQRVEAGETVGGMGATGRATGVHLHYEVWRSGKLQDPARFLKAGDYVQQTLR
jgi:murein DD-endopeptidase MepM/ murein hydrolase activator NlpD